MKKQTQYDVIIVGSGPAGALLGYLLAGKSVKTLILEKARLPRYKSCGGGLTRKTLGLLPFGIDDVIEDYTHELRVFVGKKIVFRNTSANPIMAMVMRDRFDHLLVSRALDKGAALHEGTTFRGVSGKTGGLVVETSRGNYRAQIIVGADGVNSRVARSLGFVLNRDVMHALEGEVYFNHPGVVDRFKGAADFDFLVAPFGYGWIFPKADHLSIGVLSMSKKTKNLRHFFKEYLKTKGLSGFEKIEPRAGHLIPLGVRKEYMRANSKGLLVGDAAGLTDPVTGEGIYYAAKAAQLASRSIMGVFEGREKLESYNGLLNEEFSDEMICAKRMARALYRFPRFSSRILESHGKSLGKCHIDIVSGKRRYQDLQQKIYSAFKPCS